MDLLHQPWNSTYCDRLLYCVFLCVGALRWTHSLKKRTAHPENWYCNNFGLLYEEMNLPIRFSYFRKQFEHVFQCMPCGIRVVDDKKPQPTG